MNHILLFFLIVMGVSVTRAQSSKCDYEASTNEMTKCALRELKKSDAQMNQVLNKLKRQFSKDPDALDRLEKSQAIFLRFREADAQLQGTQLKGGTGEEYLVIDSKNKLTTQRIETLSTLKE